MGLLVFKTSKPFPIKLLLFLYHLHYELQYKPLNLVVGLKKVAPFCTFGYALSEGVPMVKVI